MYKDLITSPFGNPFVQLGAPVVSQQLGFGQEHQLAALEQAGLQQQVVFGEFNCPHPDCPICREKEEARQKAQENRQAIKLLKEKDYERRCRAWVEKLRVIRGRPKKTS